MTADAAGDVTEPVPAEVRWRFPRWVLPLLFFAVGWVHFTRDNQFPYLYHTDEPGKVAQIANGNWNLRHPPLLLLATKAAARISGRATSPQAIAVLGRGVSAFFAAAAVGGLVLLAQGACGSLAGALAGVLGLASPQLFELAHYFKEDTALVFGFVLVWLAMAEAARHPGTVAALCLGAAAAVATSAKYIGIVALVFALLSEALSRRALQPRRIWQGQVVLLGAFLATAVLLNIPLLLDSRLFGNALQIEMRAVSQGEGGIANTSPMSGYFAGLLGLLGGPLLVAGILGIVLTLTLPKRISGLPRLIALFPLVYFGIVGCSPKTSSRYLLPVTVGLTFFAAVLPAMLSRLGQPWLARAPRGTSCAVAALFGAGLIFCQIGNLRPTVDGFSKDARREMIAFLNSHLTPEAKLVVERRIGLDLEIEGQEKLRPFEVQSKECAADLGSLPELRAQGFDFVLVHGPTRHMFTSNAHAPQADVQAEYDRRRTFYEQLDRECRLIWKTRKSRVGYLSPDLRVYDVAQAPSPEISGASKKGK